ncbi:hypothetical protein HDV03_002025 [Kappamyces sp. JEL0829]|nr:hypothetical protein HDV03_002025 [Kappamyces sp. JEL0829]
MAMEYRSIINDAHPKPVSCIQYNPFRREIYTAGEDSFIRVWEGESGKFLTSWNEHIGWITTLLYCKEIKVLFSSSIDGFLIAWGPNGKILQKIQTGSPIYSLAYNSRRQQLMAGHNKKVRLFQLISEDSHSSTDVLEKRNVACSEHHDIVNCLVSCEGRFYSAGYDRRIIIYDVPHHGDLKIRVTHSIKDAHDASISCMVYGKDADNSWLITGSIDRVVKLWSLDGNLIQRFDGFSDTITSLCYVLPTQTLWITANSPFPIVFDPRSGINVSDFVKTDDERLYGSTLRFKNLLYIPETNEVVGISTRRALVFWKYNAVAPLTVLPGHADIVECLTFNAKEPILIFSGGDDGIIKKWERLQLNTFMYGQESLILPKEEFLSGESTKKSEPKPKEEPRAAPKKRLTYLKKPAVIQKKPEEQSPTLSPGKKMLRPGVLSMCYYEELDLLVSGYEDSRIRIWGYNEESIVYGQDFSKHAVENQELPNENVSSRVAGMSLKVTFKEHKDAVVGLHCIKRDNRHWLLSTGWDRRIFLWNLETLELHDVFRNGNGPAKSGEELAADGMILGIDYSAERNEFGYCSSDKMAYIRKFSPLGNEMKLVAVLQGHEAEVTQIKWHRHASQWITGSEDRTIRVWPAEGIPCLRVINNDGPVTALAIDMINGCLITGSQDKIIRVFDIDKKDEIVQKNVGHSDEIRSLIHIPSRNQYVSASWDNTVRVWNAYFKKGQRKVVKSNAAKYIADEEEVAISYSETNPLIVPKLLSKPVFVKEFILEKSAIKEEDEEEEKTALEEELRQTLNELDMALNSPEKLQLNKERLKKLKAFKKK